jgi:hypothetical protein
MASCTQVLENQIVLKRTPSRLRTRPVIALFFCLVVQVWVRVEVTRSSYRLEELRSSVLRSDAVLRELKSQHAAVMSPRTLRAEAKTRLHFEPLAPQQIRKMVLE